MRGETYNNNEQTYLLNMLQLLLGFRGSGFQCYPFLFELQATDRVDKGVKIQEKQGFFCSKATTTSLCVLI